MRATCPTPLILLDLVTLTILSEEYLQIIKVISVYVVPLMLDTKFHRYTKHKEKL